MPSWPRLKPIGTRIPPHGGRVVKFWPLATLGLELTSSLLPTCSFIYSPGLLPLILFPSLEIKPGPLAVGALRGFETTR